jgi:hypothetical protein
MKALVVIHPKIHLPKVIDYGRTSSTEHVERLDVDWVLPICGIAMNLNPQRPSVALIMHRKPQASLYATKTPHLANKQTCASTKA